jgi:hypothetical protein
MSRRSGPIVALLLCGGLAACGGGGGGTTTVTPPASPPPAASFRTLSAPSGFAMESASVRSKAVTADALLAGGPMPAGYDSPQVHTWVNFFYTDGDGVARTLAIVRWSVLASLGTQGMRLELPSAASSLQYDVYNANGSRSGSLSR